MTPQRHARIKDLFLAAAALPESRRREFLEQSCAGDQELRAEVEKLLKHQSEGEPSRPARRVRVLPGEPAADDAGKNEATRPPPASAPAGVSAASRSRNLPPGTMVGDRYRIVSMLGRGGMGEVYRADDLTLNQPVALKFLPASLAGDPNWLARLRREVRVARRVSHPNVCRVHDVGESGGDWFISMEYVDGEDLHALLKRIGRLPQDKGVDIARQLCSGIAAAHARKVLHCDLKPGNVMLDGRGKAVITDFGLAVPSDEITRSDIRAGTPAYMAPEQLTGKSVTVRSDLYALGLVLYEAFTGQPTFRADTPREYAALKLRSRPSPPSLILPDLDPEVERVILRCLERDPRDRPASALAVLAALPGSDPLAAAMAAGETPSPEWVADAERHRGPRKRLRTAGFAAFLALLVIAILLSSKAHPVAAGRLDKSPGVLAEKAREFLGTFDEKGVSSRHQAYGFTEGLPCPWVAAPREDAPFTFIGKRGSPLVFWRLESPTPLATSDAFKLVFGDAGATPADPQTTGTRLVVLDGDGRLVGLEAAGRLAESTSPAGLDFDWAPWLLCAGLDPGKLHETTSLQAPRLSTHDRRAWLGTHPHDESLPIRVEAAACAGSPVYFAVLTDPAAVPAGVGNLDAGLRQERIDVTRAVLLTILVIASLPLARRNIRLGRCDFRGSFRLAAFLLVIRLASWVLQAPHTSHLEVEFRLLRLAVVGALAEGALVALFYVALEPIVRRFWPESLVAWTRILAGRIRDSFVGLNVLMGACLGVFWTVLVRLDSLITPWLGLRPRPLLRPADFFTALTNARQALAFTLDALRRSTYDALFLLLMIALLRATLRRTWLAHLMGILLIVPMFVPRGSHVAVSLFVYGIGGAALGLLVLTRFGPVPLITALFVNHLLRRFPLTLDVGAWYADFSAFALLVVIAVAASAFWAARRVETGPAPRLAAST